MPCVICGDPKTVRSHLVPRSLAREVKGNDKSLSHVSRIPGRPQSSAAGPFDRNLLCDKHEKVTADLDAYGMKFIRKARQLASLEPQAQTIAVPNPHPSKLIRFIASIIWRGFVSPHGEDNPTELGQFRGLLEQFVFCDEQTDAFTAVAAITSYRIGTLKGRIIVLPWRVATPNRFIWHMELGGISFLMEAGDHAEFKRITAARLEVSDPAMVLINGEVDALTWQPVADIFRAANARRLR